MRLFAIALLACGLFVGCQKDKNNNPQYYAGAPGAACFQNNSGWGTSLGFRPYQYGYMQDSAGRWVPVNNYNYQSQGFCGCPAQSQPACGPTGGMVCIPNAQLAGSNWVPWGYNGNSFYQNNYQPNPYTSTGYACSTNIGQTCRVGYNDCGYGICSGKWGSYGICVQP